MKTYGMKCRLQDGFGNFFRVDLFPVFMVDDNEFSLPFTDQVNLPGNLEFFAELHHLCRV